MDLYNDSSKEGCAPHQTPEREIIILETLQSLAMSDLRGWAPIAHIANWLI